MPSNATGFVMASGASNTNARNWGLYTNYSDWGHLDFRVSSAKDAVAHTTEVLSLKRDKSAVFSGNVQISHATTPDFTLNDTGGTTNRRVFRISGGGDAVYFEGMNNDNSGAGDAGSIATMSLSDASTTFSGVLKVQKAGSGNAIGIFEDPSGNANLLISATTANKNSILNFGDSANAEVGQLDFDHADNSFVFRIDGSERFEIKDTTGNGAWLTYLNTDLKIMDDLYFNSANAWLIALAGGGTLRVQTFATFRVDGVIHGYDDVIAYYSSDPTLKDNAKLIENPLDKLSKINGYTFDWNEKAQKLGKHLTGHDYGVMANEIQDVMPELVETRENGIRAVKYEKIIPLLIECIKKQQTQINELKGIA